MPRPTRQEIDETLQDIAQMLFDLGYAPEEEDEEDEDLEENAPDD